MSKRKKKAPSPRNRELFETLLHVKPGRHNTGKKDKKKRREAQEDWYDLSEI